MRKQNSQLQAQISKIQEASTSILISTPQKLPQESIREIVEEVFGEMQDKFRQLREQSTKVSEDLEEIGANVCQFWCKINSRAESLEHHIWKIYSLFDEDRNFGIEGIAKEVGMLKGKISEAVIEFGSMLVAFEKQQTKHFSKLMDAIKLLLNEISIRLH